MPKAKEAAIAKPFILFADDNRDIIDMLGAMAEARGYRYQTASSAEGMLEQINLHCSTMHSCFDIVVGDLCYQKPGAVLDGLTALREIRKRFPDLPFIFLSGMMEALTETEAKRLGAYVQKKPIDLEEFFDRLDAILSMTRGTYRGEERRRRSINLTTNNRRCDDPRYLEDVQLGVPPVLAEVHRELAAKK